MSLTSAAAVIRLFLLAGLVLSIILTTLSAIRDLQHLSYLVSNCRPIQGEITSRHWIPSHHETLYFLNYTYFTGGASYNDVEKVSSQTFFVNPPGSPITLAYLPQNPKIHFIGTITHATMQEGIDNWIIRALIIIGFLGLFAVGNELALRNERGVLRQAFPVCLI